MEEHWPRPMARASPMLRLHQQMGDHVLCPSIDDVRRD